MNWNNYFAIMEDWKRLPAYKAEPRIDSLVGFYLPEMASEFLKDNIVGIIPELPIRLGTVKPQHNGSNFADRSYKVDFYLLGASGKNYFVEFKTDSSSRRDKQDDYLRKSNEKGMAEIINGIQQINEASSYKKKYGHLRSKLESLGLIKNEWKYTGKTDAIEIVYVQPHRKEDDIGTVVDFAWIAKWLTDKYGQNEFEAAFANTLSKWGND